MKKHAHGIVIGAFLCVAAATMTAALARQQPGDQPASSQERPSVRTDPTVAELRKSVIRLRAEVELLEIEHEVDKAHLMEALKELRLFNSDADRALLVREGVAKIRTFAASLGMLEDLTKEFGDEKTMEHESEKEAREIGAKTQMLNNQLKKEFLDRTIELNQKRFELADHEKQLARISPP